MGSQLATALIVAAGSGERLGSEQPKGLVELAGRPMYEWSLLALAASRTVDRAVVAVPQGSAGEVGRRVSASHGEWVATVEGGDARSDSVHAALGKARSEVVVVHDAARPLVSSMLIDAVVARLTAESLECGGVIAATPLGDTVKRADPPTIEGGAPVVRETVDRGGLWAVQTPQAFRATTLRMALEAAGDLSSATDDAMLVERLDRRVLIQPSSVRNLKVTTSEDLEMAGLLLSASAS